MGTKRDTHGIAWWQRAVIYQIYPRSFQDSNGDGVGDLVGIISRLDYLRWLGIDAIWISPVYCSPMADFGYDISDHCDIDPIFGTLADADNLIQAAHSKGLKVIFDYVPNHTSSQHPWFIDAISSKTSSKRDWYVWHDPAVDGGPPNNWLSRFDGRSAWEFDQMSGQYYLHSFLKEQPDVNWRNRELQEEMLKVMRFWFDRGIDGLRVDVAYRGLKDPEFRNNPSDPLWHEGKDPANRFLEIYNKNYKDIHILNRILRSVADEYDDKVLIGEMYLSIKDLVKHYGVGDEFHLPYNFNLLHTPWNPKEVLALIETYEAVLPVNEWPTWVLGNHDQHRVATRLGLHRARAAAMMLLTLKGTPTIYYGEELGMEDGDIPLERIQDPWEKNVSGLGLGRDPERTPMQWSSEPNAGFTQAGVEPWLPIGANYKTANVACQQEDPQGFLVFMRDLLSLRKQSPALQAGGYEYAKEQDGMLFYRRTFGSSWAEVYLNFTSENMPLKIEQTIQRSERVFSTHAGAIQAGQSKVEFLSPEEGLLLLGNAEG